MDLTLNEYQDQAEETALYPKEWGLQYTALGLVGEAGEVANKVKKVIRDKGGVVDMDAARDLKDELGDVLWYVANLASEINYHLDDVAADNLRKLADRMRRGVIQGSGDRR